MNISTWDAARVLDIRINKGKDILCVNSYTLSVELAHAVNDASYAADIATVKDPVAAIISKGLPVRCHGRKSGTVIEKTTIESPSDIARNKSVHQKWHDRENATPPNRKRDVRDVKFVLEFEKIIPRAKQMRQLVLCAMLGNYPHSMQRIHSFEGRKLLYRTIRSKYGAWYQSLLHGCPLLVVWCVREYMVHAIRDNVALLEQVREMMHFDAFCDVVSCVMSTLRTYINDNITCSFSSLVRSIRKPPKTMCDHLRAKVPKGSPRPACVFNHTWLFDVEAMLKPFHESMLAIQYNKPKVDAVVWLVSSDVRKEAPLVAIPRTEADAAAAAASASNAAQADEEMDEGADEDDEQNLFDGNHNASRDISRIIANYRLTKLRKKQNDKARNIDRSITSNAFIYISKAQFDSLKHLITLCANRIEVVMQLVHAGGFGVSLTTQRYINTLLAHHRLSSIPKLARFSMLRRLHALQPHAYNLLQITAELIKKNGASGTGGRIVGTFPVETCESQLVAARNKLISLWSTPAACAAIEGGAVAIAAQVNARFDASDVEKTSCSLYFCHVCSTVYSNVRDSSESVIKYYTYGLYHPRMRYSTGELFCKNGQVNHLGACKMQVLSSVPLLGIRYAFGKSVYQLCVVCSATMVPDKRCTFNDDGQLCYACTAARTVKQDTMCDDSFMASLGTRQCACCESVTTTEQSTFLYPHGLVICRHHTNRHMVNFVKSQPAHTSKADLLKLISSEHFARKEMKRLRAQPGEARAMRIKKSKDRNRKH